MEDFDTVVLGAGLSGMSFAYHYDRNIPLFEKESIPGGLTRTLEAGGFKFDLAPHLLHLRSDYAKNLVFNELSNKFDKFERRSAIYINEKIIPYPFELNLSGLDVKTRKECLAGVQEIKKLSLQNIKDLQKGSYQDYVLEAFGKGIAKHYLLPYNRKIWDTDPVKMTCEWMKLLPTLNKEEIIANTNKKSSKPFGYNASFYYPAKNGIQELADSFASRLSNIRLNESAIAIDSSKRTVQFASGRVVRYRTLVSTIPLKDLVDIAGNERLKEKARDLQHTTVYNINLIVSGEISNDLHWIYFPDSEIEFYRISFPKKYFANSAPGDQHILSIEIGSRNHDLNIEELQQKTIARIKKIKTYKIEKIIHSHIIKIPVAYCIYDRKRTLIVNELAAKFNSLGIKTIGRYGRWEYSAMEDAMLYGRDLAAELRISQ